MHNHSSLFVQQNEVKFPSVIWVPSKPIDLTQGIDHASQKKTISVLFLGKETKAKIRFHKAINPNFRHADPTEASNQLSLDEVTIGGFTTEFNFFDTIGTETYPYQIANYLIKTDVIFIFSQNEADLTHWKRIIQRQKEDQGYYIEFTDKKLREQLGISDEGLIDDNQMRQMGSHLLQFVCNVLISGDIHSVATEQQAPSRVRVNRL